MGMKEFWSMQLMATRPWYLEPLWVGLQVLLFCLLAGMLFYRRYRFRLRRSEMHNEALQDQLRRLQLQLNPHFLYNALSSIAGLVVNRQYEEANVYLSEFGRLLREAIECSKPGRPFSLKEELIMLERYCRLEQLRFGFRYTIESDPALQPAEVQLPAMLVQPLVENAILHGVHGLKEAGHISISYQREGRHFVIRVTDNGPGFKKDNSHQGTGIGLALTRQRIKYMSDLSGADIRFSLVREANHTVASIRFSEWFEEYPNSHL
jgi:sensor histidine kinase YesM